MSKYKTGDRVIAYGPGMIEGKIFLYNKIGVGSKVKGRIVNQCIGTENCYTVLIEDGLEPVFNGKQLRKLKRK